MNIIQNPAFLYGASNRTRFKNFFYIESIENENVISFPEETRFGFTNNREKIQYCINDRNEWNTVLPEVIVLNAGDRLYLQNPTSETLEHPDTSQEFFVSSKKINIGGEISQLIDPLQPYGEELFEDYEFKYAFRECKIVSASALVMPKIKVGYACCLGMFEGCNYLVEAPNLTTSIVYDLAYKEMFKGCVSLIKAPQIKSVDIGVGSFSSMFEGCTNLIQAPNLPSTPLDDQCYASMFKGCVSLVEAPELPALELEYACYASMFEGCISLTKAPILPAPIIIESCYNRMFNGCSALDKILCLGEYEYDPGTSEWLDGVASVGTFIKSPNMDHWSVGSDGIPSGWTIEDYVA